MPENKKKKDTHSCTIYGPERAIKKYTIKNWFLEKAALALAFYELSIGLISIIPSIEKKPCDSKDCSSINCQLMQDENWLKRIVGNNLDIHGHVMSGLLNLGESIFEELTEDEENVTLEETQDFLSEDILKARDAAIEDLKRLGLIEGDSLNFSVEDFKSIKLSLKDINNINAISQIYAYELAIMAYDLDAVDTYYKGIKNKIEDTYYKSKSDFATSSGFESIEEYESTALEYIKAMNGEIGIGASSIIESIHLSEFSIKYNGYNGRKTLIDIKREKKQVLTKKRNLGGK